MKRNLNQNQYQLNDHERENLWHDIRRETVGPANSHNQQGALRPSLAVTAVLAVVTLSVAWHMGSQQIGQKSLVLDPARMEVLALNEESGEPSRFEMKQVRSVAAVAPAPPVLTGRVVDRETGEALAYANVMIRGTTRGVMTDSLGYFRFENMPAGQDIELMVKMLSYEPVEIALNTPIYGAMKQDVDLEPIITETLQSFDVEGGEYMIETSSALRQNVVSSETFEKYAIDSVEDAKNKKAGVVMRAGEL